MKKLKILLFTILISFIGIININAAGKITISTSNSKVVVGSTVTVTVKVTTDKPYGTLEMKLGYDKNKFKLTSGDAYMVGYTSNGKDKTKTYTLKFKAIATGSGTFSISSYSVLDYSSEKEVSMTKNSKTVSVITQAQLEASYSKNNDLKALSVSGCAISPTFNKDTLNYKCEAGANTQTVKVSATKSDSKAMVSGTGNHAVSEGENKIKVIVTAENGKTKTYTIIVNVVDPNPIKVKIGENEYTLVKRESNLDAPENFNKKTIDYDGQKVPAFYNELNELTLLGLKNEDGDINLFIYQDNEFTLYNEIELDKVKILPLQINEKFDKLEKTTIKIENVEYDALIINGTYIIHARNLLSAKDGYYIYDPELNTIATFDEGIINTYKADAKKYKNLTMILGCESVFLILVLIVLLASKIDNSNKTKKEIKKQETKENKKEIKTEEIKENVVKEDKKAKKEINKKKEEKQETKEKDKEEIKQEIKEEKEQEKVEEAKDIEKVKEEIKSLEEEIFDNDKKKDKKKKEAKK